MPDYIFQSPVLPGSIAGTAPATRLTSGASSAATENQPGMFERSDLGSCADRLIQQATSFPELANQLASLIGTTSSCRGLWGIQSASDSQQSTSIPLLSGSPDFAPLESLARVLTESSAGDVISAGTRCGATLVAGPAFAPLGNTEEPQLWIAGLFDRAESAQQARWWIEWYIQILRRWHQKQVAASLQSQHAQTAALLAAISGVEQSNSLAEAVRSTANHLQRLSGCDHVVVAVGTSAKNIESISLSGMDRVPRNSEIDRVLRAAAEAPMLAGKRLSWCQSGTTETGELQALALESLGQHLNCSACLAIPIKQNEKQVLGAVLFAGDAVQLQNPEQSDRLEHWTTPLGNCLANVQLAYMNPLAKIKRRIAERLRGGIGRTVAAAVALCLLAMLLPWPYRVHCDCTVQPVLRRFVAAPHDGILENSHVAAGDVVDPGQLLARLDARALRIELAGLEAEYDGALKQRDSALASGKVAQSQIAASDMKRLRAKIDSLGARLVDLDIRSPIGGLVVSGDLEKAHGAPVETGQTLFEIAPLDVMLAEIGIPEAEIRFVDVGMQVEIQLHSFPAESFSATVERIHPRTETIDGDVVFIAEVKIDNPSGLLKPGMDGTARIATGWGLVGWNLFHRPWEACRYWTVW